MSTIKQEIEYQAHQGSVSAIISILNQRLQEHCITTRAILDHGKLQLLCEADQQESLEKSVLVVKLQSIFNQIAPTNFDRVIINTRITKKQQSLWLEEIKNDRENQLLWYQEIKIKKPNFLQNIFLKYQYFQQPEVRKKEILHDLARQKNKSGAKVKNQLPWQLIITGSVTILIIIGGWYFSFSLGQNSELIQTSDTENNDSNEANITESNMTNTKENDPFHQAVNLANSAYAEGIKAQTKTQWLDIAEKWRTASNLMQQVTLDHPRFPEAQERIESYQKNSEVAIYKASQL